MLTNLLSHQYGKRLATPRCKDELLDLLAPICCAREQRSVVSVEMHRKWQPAYPFVVAVDLIFAGGGRL